VIPLLGLAKGGAGGLVYFLFSLLALLRERRESLERLEVRVTLALDGGIRLAG
jgi:hypothetical protein